MTSSGGPEPDARPGGPVSADDPAGAGQVAVVRRRLAAALPNGLSRLFAPLVGAALTAVADPRPPRSSLPRIPLPLLRRLPVRLADVYFVIEVLLAWTLFASGMGVLPTGNEVPGAWVFFASAAASWPLVLRQRWPLAAWRTAMVGNLASVPIIAVVVSPDLFTGPAIVTLLLCTYSVAVRCDRSTTVGAWLFTVAATAVVNPEWAPVAALVVAIPALFGYNVRVRRQAQRSLRTAEQLRAEEREAAAVLAERARIARELHDVVAHHMSVIAIQAEAAPLANPDTPEDAKRSFAEIRTTALEALTETRRILGVLRDGAAGGETAPQPGLDRLEDLVSGSETVGLHTSLSVSGEPQQVPPGVGLSAYRIVQESLSNAMRHAPGSTVTVDVDYRKAGTLRLGIVNGSAPGEPRVDEERPDGVRHGLVGMRERAAMLGGELIAEPTPDGGFAVRATLPLEDR